MSTTAQSTYIAKAAKKTAKMLRKICKDWTPEDVREFLARNKALEKYPAAIYCELEAQIIFELC